MRALAGASGPNMLAPPSRGLSAPFRAAARSQSGRAAGPRTGVHADAAGPGTDARKDGLSEDMVARLRAAEAEAAALREQLAAARRQAPADAEEVKGNWLREIDFLTGGGPSEADAEPAEGEASSAGTVQRRLLIGVVLTAAALAFALVPTDSLRIVKPPKPLFFYLVPLIRALLREMEALAEAGQWGELEAALQRVQGAPNDAATNLRYAAILIEDAAVRGKAEALSRDTIEYLDAVNPNSYYESLGRPGMRGGERERQLATFSRNAIVAAEAKLKAFLALMPRDALDAARQQASLF